MGVRKKLTKAAQREVYIGEVFQDCLAEKKALNKSPATITSAMGCFKRWYEYIESKAFFDERCGTDLCLFVKQLEKRGITLDDAQHYADSAIICFKQSDDKTMFASEDGVVVVLGNGGIATAYPRSWYVGDIWDLLEEVRKYGRRK